MEEKVAPEAADLMRGKMGTAVLVAAGVGIALLPFLANKRFPREHIPAANVEIRRAVNEYMAGLSKAERLILGEFKIIEKPGEPLVLQMSKPVGLETFSGHMNRIAVLAQQKLSESKNPVLQKAEMRHTLVEPSWMIGLKEKANFSLVSTDLYGGRPARAVRNVLEGKWLPRKTTPRTGK